MSKAAFLKELAGVIAERAAPAAEKKAIRAYHGTRATDLKRVTELKNKYGGYDEIGQGFEHLSPDVNFDQLGLHAGTVPQANFFAGVKPEITDEDILLNPHHYANEVEDHARVIPLDLHLENPLRLEDRHGDWLPTNIYKQLVEQGKIEHNNGDYLYLRQLQGSRDPVTRLEATDMIRKIIEGLGHDGVVYRNRVEGLPLDVIKDRMKSHPSYHRPSEISDEDFIQRVPESQDSYIVWNKDKYKSPFGEGTGAGWAAGGPVSPLQAAYRK